MADGYISQIKTPDNKTYLLRDSEKTDEKVSQASNSENKEFPIILKNTNNTTNETAGVKYAGGVTVNPSEKTVTADEFIGNLNMRRLVPISTKTYNAPLYQSSGANFYQNFATVTPTDYNAIWIAHYRITVTAAGHSDYTEICDVSISGRANTYYSYKIYNSIVTYSIYQHMLLNSNSVSVPHELGYRMQGSYGADSVAKVIKVELLEQLNCTVTLLDNLKLYTSATPSGYTWRGFNATSNGLQETGDNDAYGYYILSNGFKGKAGSNKVYRQCLFARTGDGTYESFVMESNTRATTKTANPHGFVPDGKIYWNSSGSDYSAGTLNISPYEQYHTLDYLYSFNFDNQFLPDYCETYVVYTYNEDDGLLYLDTTQWLAAALPTTEDGKIYQRIGSKYYTGTSNYYQGSLLLDNPYYEYRDGEIRSWSATHLSSITGADDLKAIEVISGTSGLLKKTAANTWTLDTNNYVTSSGITSVTIGATSPVQSSTSTAQNGSSASTTISLKDAYGDTKNPYGAKAKNLVLAGPSSGSNAAPTFRTLVAADIPSLAYVPATSGANDINTLVNTGIYNITSGSLTNGPVGYGYGQLLVMSYRKHTGNTTTDWATQLYAHLGSGNNGNTLYFRTSNASTWQTWQMVAHANAGTGKGGTTTPIYINAKGEIQEGTALKDLAYISKGTGSTKFLREDGTWQTALTAHQTYTAFTGNPADNQTPGFGSTFTIQQISQSTTGQVSGTDRTVTIPAITSSDIPITLTRAQLVSTEQMAFTNWLPKYGSGTAIPAKTMALFADGLAIKSPATSTDAGWIRVTGTDETDTVLEIATSDDANKANSEKIVVRQYNSSSAQHEAILLGKIGDVYGATSFPVQVSAPKFIGNLTGTADKATADADNNTISTTYLKKSGGQMTGPLTWKDGTALPQASSLSYVLGIDAFASGGTTKWIGIDGLRTSLGLSNALHFIGQATTALADGDTGTPTISGKTYSTKTAGDVVLGKDDGREYVWTGSAWEILGQDASTTYDSGAAATNTWVSRIQQASDRTITVTTAALDTSGTWSGNAATATTATNLANNPSIQASTSNANQVTITAGGKTSSAYTVPYATSAGSATSATTATYIKCTDTRSTALNPTDLNAAQGVRFDFKAKGTINLTATDAYAGVMSFRPYASNTDWSGGNAHQLAFNSEGLHWRNGGASWGNWYQILDSSNTSAVNANGAVISVARDTDTKIATINGVDIKIKIPASDNSWRPIGTGANDAMAGNTNVNNVTQTATSSSYTYWRPLLVGDSNGTADTFTVTTKTGATYGVHSIKVQPSSGTIKATTFQGNLTGNVTGNVSGSAGSVAWSGVSGKPTNLSDFTNDVGYLTSYTETDPTVPAWAKASNKPSYTASEVGALPDTTTVTNVAISQNITTNSNYPVVFATSNKDTTGAKNEGLQKSGTKFYFNPNSGNLQATTFNGYTLAAASAKAVVTSIDTSASLPTSNAVKTFVEGKGYVTSSDITTAINDLDGTITGSGSTTKTITALSQTNGKVSATFSDIAFPVSSVAGLSGAITANNLTEALGLSKALRFVGVTTTDMTGGTATNHTYTGKPAGISNYTPAVGDVVINSTKQDEWVCTTVSGTTYTWERLGSDTSYKIVQSAVSDPTAASTTSTTFIDTISQNANGVISATKKTLPTASTEVAGIIKIGTAATDAMAGNTTVTNVSYTAATDDNEYPVLMKNSTGSDTTAAGVRFASGTNQQVTINPSTGTVSTRRLVINNSSSNGTVPDLVFSRTSWSYINIPDNDAAVLAIGRGTGDNASQKLIIQGDGVVRPGSDNTQVLGKSTRRWKEVHGVNFYGTFNGTATYSQGLAKWAISNSDLNNFVSNGALRYSWEGGNNGFNSKPTDVNAFGVIAMKTATNWTGQLLMSTDSEPGLYWRTNLTTETPSYGSWTPLASGNGGVYYGTCATATNVVEKVVVCKHYHTLKAGDIIVVTFDNANTQAQPQLNVNNTGAVGVKMAYSGGIVDLGSTTQLSYTCTFIYNGTYWLIINQQNAIQIATASNQTNWRSILLSNSNDGDENFTPSANTLGRTYAAHNVKYQPSTGTLRAPIMKTPKVQIEYDHVNKAHIQWNDTDSSIDFIFD